MVKSLSPAKAGFESFWDSNPGATLTGKFQCDVCGAPSLKVGLLPRLRDKSLENSPNTANSSNPRRAGRSS